jgi:CO dehydrogenase/acetyl-CoA synthase gamma subunit (corrinoid Fe-S protein)
MTWNRIATLLLCIHVLFLVEYMKKIKNLFAASRKQKENIIVAIPLSPRSAKDTADKDTIDEASKDTIRKASINKEQDPLSQPTMVMNRND